MKEKLDVHAGGIDLKFPHHENEIAQCCAHYNLSSIQTWPRYFFHTGHLHIAGRKMSKSLKNFISIKEFLQEGEDRAKLFRIFCLLNRYGTSIEYSQDRMKDASTIYQKITNFLQTTNSLIRESNKRTLSRKWDTKEYELSRQ